MIRKLTPEDLDAVMHIWLSSNLEAHSFVPAAYWHGHFEQVRAVLPTAAVYVHEEPAGHVDGFIGLFGDDIAGLFVEQAARSKGVGKCLLDHVKARRAHLQLQGYQKNRRALAFYLREGFRIQAGETDADTCEKAYVMTWQCAAGSV